MSEVRIVFADGSGELAPAAFYAKVVEVLGAGCFRVRFTSGSAELRTRLERLLAAGRRS